VYRLRGGAVFSVAVHFRIGVRVGPAHRPASPCVIDRALRLSSFRRARPAAPAGPMERFFFSWLHYCTAFSTRSERGPRDSHAHDPRKNRIQSYGRFRSSAQPLRTIENRIFVEWIMRMILCCVLHHSTNIEVYKFRWSLLHTSYTYLKIYHNHLCCFFAIPWLESYDDHRMILFICSLAVFLFCSKQMRKDKIYKIDSHTYYNMLVFFIQVFIFSKANTYNNTASF